MYNLSHYVLTTLTFAKPFFAWSWETMWTLFFSVRSSQLICWCDSQNSLNNSFPIQTRRCGHISDISVKCVLVHFPLSVVAHEAPLAQKSLLNHIFMLAKSANSWDEPEDEWTLGRKFFTLTPNWVDSYLNVWMSVMRFHRTIFNFSLFVTQTKSYDFGRIGIQRMSHMVIVMSY